MDSEQTEEVDWLDDSKRRMRSMQSKEILRVMDTPSSLSVCLIQRGSASSQRPSLVFSDEDALMPDTQR